MPPHLPTDTAAWLPHRGLSEQRCGGDGVLCAGSGCCLLQWCRWPLEQGSAGTVHPQPLCAPRVHVHTAGLTHAAAASGRLSPGAMEVPGLCVTHTVVVPGSPRAARQDVSPRSRTFQALCASVPSPKAGQGAKAGVEGWTNGPGLLTGQAAGYVTKGEQFCGHFWSFSR